MGWTQSRGKHCSSTSFWGVVSINFIADTYQQTGFSKALDGRRCKTSEKVESLFISLGSNDVLISVDNRTMTVCRIILAMSLVTLVTLCYNLIFIIFRKIKKEMILKAMNMLVYREGWNSLSCSHRRHENDSALTSTTRIFRKSQINLWSVFSSRVYDIHVNPLHATPFQSNPS